MTNKKFVKLTEYKKEDSNIILDGASQGKITAYVKHKDTGANIPIDSRYITRMKNGETFDISEAERKNNRRYFKIDKLSIRWDMEPDDVLRILYDFNVPCFFKINEVEHNETTATVGCNDVCAFEEYILAIENRKRLKKKNVNSTYQGFHEN